MSEGKEIVRARGSGWLLWKVFSSHSKDFIHMNSLTVSVAACMRPVQDWASLNSSVDLDWPHAVIPLVEELLATDCWERRVTFFRYGPY